MPGVRSLVLIVLVTGFLAGVTPALAQSSTPSPAPVSEPADQVVLSGRVSVPRGETVGEIVVFHGRVLVQGVAHGDVVVISGSIEITGQVGGDVVALDGTVRLAPSAQVAGSVRASGAVAAASGASVAGGIRQNASFTLGGPLEALGGFLSWAAVAFSSLVFGVLLLLLIPRVVEAVGDAGRTAVIAAAAWGIALFLAIPLLTIAVAATVLGLPLAVLVALALGLVMFVGYVWAIAVVGRLLVAEPRSRWLAFLAGWAVFSVVGLVPIVSGIVWTLAAIFGVGAMAVATWRARGPVRRGRHREGSAKAPVA
jgi:hypothetical protein